MAKIFETEENRLIQSYNPFTREIWRLPDGEVIDQVRIRIFAKSGKVYEMDIDSRIVELVMQNCTCGSWLGGSCVC